MSREIKALSLFANVGIAETYLEQCGIDVVVANEIDAHRVRFYKHLYPKTEVIEGDITQNDIINKVIELSKEKKIELIIATPPCQGMSTAGKKDKNDSRNLLITHTVKIIKALKPKYVLLENVPEQLKTKINVNNKQILIPDYIFNELNNLYKFNKNQLINTMDYGVPQSRERAIFLLTRKNLKNTWEFPEKEAKKVTLKDSIYNLPSLDPELYDLSEEEQLKIFPEFKTKKEQGLKISKWHYPPKHIYRQVYSLMHTPTGESAFNNIDEFKPKKDNGTYVKGFKNTYKRQSWDKPGCTITMHNRTISSQNNVHPGHYLGKDDKNNDIYSDARVFTIYELLIVSSLPKDWNIPDWASEPFIRQVIGEGIPPLLIKKIMMELNKIYE